MHQKKFPLGLFVLATFFTAAILFGSGTAARSQQEERIPDLPTMPYQYANLQLPAHFNQPNIANTDNEPANNPVTDSGATLGRVLFYDRLLSVNDTVSCSSCHIQANGFSDPATLSVGFEGELTGRHSMGLANARYYQRSRFFWDERAATLEDQVLQPIQDDVEMGLTLSELETKLAATSYYPQLFEDAFGTQEITSERVSFALAQFVRSMVSYESKYDEGVGQNFANFTAEEARGRQVFTQPQLGGCAGCHGTDIQIASRVDNNGLDATTTDEGAGNGRFKVPSLRNIEVRPPYMHDGRFATLEEVVEHYNSGVQAHPDLAPPLRLPGPGPVRPRRLNLSQADKDALVAFMETLTDNSFTTAERFADPFVEVTPTSTPTAADTATATPTANPTDTPAPTNTIAPSATPVPTDTSVPTATIVPTGTSSPTDTPTTTATVAPTATSAPTATVVPSATSIPTGTSSPTNMPTATATVAPSDTSVPNTSVPTETPTVTATVAPLDTVIPINTALPNETATPTATNTVEATVTTIPSTTPTVSPSVTAVPSVAATAPSATPIATSMVPTTIPTRSAASTPDASVQETPTVAQTATPPATTVAPTDTGSVFATPDSVNQNSNSSGGNGQQRQRVYLPVAQ